MSPSVQHAERRAMSSFPARVVQIGGASRSGTTLLELLLTERMGAVSLGEVHHLFARGIVRNERCSCGAAFWDCDWWSGVAETVFGPPVKARARVAKVIEQEWSSIRRYPAVRARRSSRLPAFESIVGDLFTVLAERAGGRWLIDSSKDPAWFEVTGRVTHRTELVHVVRDVRGVVASSRRTVVRPEVDDRVELMPRTGLVRTVAEWSAFNALTAIVRSSDHYRQIRYEELCADPGATVDRLHAELAFGERPRPPILHSVSGNPLRFRSVGLPDVRLDDAWRRELSPLEAVAAAALGWPAGRVIELVGRRRAVDRFESLRSSGRRD